MGSTSSGKRNSIKLKNYVSWFEIPAVNFEQAVSFYNRIYGIDMETINTSEHTMAFFPNRGGVCGAIICGPGSVPNENGPLVYLNGGEDLNRVLGKVEEAGGRVVMQKTLISEEAGFFAIFLDCEGNKLALHSNN